MVWIPNLLQTSGSMLWLLAMDLVLLSLLDSSPTSVSLNRKGSRHGFHLTSLGDGMKSRNG